MDNRIVSFVEEIAADSSVDIFHRRRHYDATTNSHLLPHGPFISDVSRCVAARCLFQCERIFTKWLRIVIGYLIDNYNNMWLSNLTRGRVAAAHG